MGTQLLTAVDLFCGCGGISCGLRDAGFRVLAGIDNTPEYLQTFSANFPNALSLCADVSQTKPSMVLSQIGLKKGELTLLAGGPPCQGFSKNVPRKNRVAEDPRNQMIYAFLRFAEAFMPRFVLLENVAEMKAGFDGAYTNLLIESLEAKHLGYHVQYGVLNAQDYGVPQKRRRTFFLASRDNESASFPAPTHHGADAASLFSGSPYTSVWDAIGDLPLLEHGQGTAPCAYAALPQNDFQKQARGKQTLVSNHVARFLQPTQLARLSCLKPGQGLRDLPDTLRPKSGYSGAYGRLTKEMTAPTITRWVFHPGSGRFGHPVQARVITIREAARLQAFPDHFSFKGTYIQQSHQIGNAVPPLLIQKIGDALQTIT